MARGEPIRALNGPDGKVRAYRVVVDVGRDAAGKRKQLTHTAPTRKAAREWLAETLSDAKRGTLVLRSEVTLDGLLDRWLDGRRDVRAVTVQGYRDVLAPVRKRLGGKRVQEVTVADVDALVTWMLSKGGQRGQGLSTRSVTATLGALSQALDLAERVGLVSRNVARIVKRPRTRQDEIKTRPVWTAEQAAAFRTVALRDPWAAAWLLALAGMRRSEILGLRWSAVDLDAGTVTVERGRVQVTPTEDAVDDPKATRSRRTLPVSVLPGVVPALRRARLAAPPSTDLDPYVVVDADGRPPRPEWFSDRFRALCRDAGVPPIRLHETRHTLVSHLRAQGLSDDDIAAWLGHSVAVMLATYSRPLPGSHERVAKAMRGLYAV